MDLNEYQQRAKTTDELAPAGEIDAEGLVYTVNELRYAFGLSGEAGELAEKYKKSLRASPEGETLSSMAGEVGDILWYVALLADELNYTLEEIAEMNLAKLEDRQERDVIAGSGDDR